MTKIDELLKHKRAVIDSAKRNTKLTVPDEDRRQRWNRGTFRIIAEIKRASLSAGSILSSVVVPSLAREYASAGASALSVLTEEKYFHGSLEDLRAVRAAVQVPILQKDFVLDPFQIEEAKIAGADFVLLIARFLEREQLNSMIDFCEQIKLNALIEVTNEADLKKLERKVRYLGVNSRNLRTLEVDTKQFARLRPNLPDAYLIAESGISDLETLNRVIDLGYHGALIGEHFLRCADPAEELRHFVQFALTKQRTGPGIHRPCVKICGITSETDAFLAIQEGADALGFIFADSPRRIDPDLFASFRARIPSTVLCVGVFKGQSQGQIDEIMRRFNLDVAQIYDPLDLNGPVWRAKLVTKLEDFRREVQASDPVLWDIKSHEPDLMKFWMEASKSNVFALAGGLHPQNVAHAVSICRPEWVDVARGVESSPGKKDPKKLTAFFKELSI
jgi:indole-3-glycerol phosphate synthase/phosphoribosylanthranilate isomerase